MTDIRAATDDDADAVAAVFGGYVLHSIVTFVETPPSAEEWRARIRESSRVAGHPFLVAEVDGVVVGFARAAPYRPYAAYRYTVEDSIYIAPQAANRGLGGRLIGALIDALAGTEVRQVVAIIAVAAGTRHDTPSIVLHRRAGFVEVGRLLAVGHKNGQWADTVLMQRDLHAPS